MNKVTDFLQQLWGYFSIPLLEVGGQKLTVMSLISAFIIFYGVIKLSRLGESLTQRLLKEHNDLDAGVCDSITRFVRYAILTIGVLVTLDTLGVSMSSLAAVGAVLMVGIGFGLQNITQNFISGLIIMFERPIKVGDLVEVEGVSGKVMTVGARSTLIHTRDDVAIIIPNSQFISEQVINQSYSGDNIRIKISIGVSYKSDPRVVESSLIEVALAHPYVLKSPAPKVFFDNFGNSSLDFTISVWIKEQWVDEGIKSDLRFAIMKSFKENNIDIPYPQMDLHFKDSPRPELT